MRIDRQSFPRPDGKGNARQAPHGSDNPWRGGGGQGQRAKRGAERRQDWSWGQASWGGNRGSGDDDDLVAKLQAEVALLTTLILRHEDAINIWHALCSYVIFAKSGIPVSLVPALFAAKAEWVKLKQLGESEASRSMCTALLFHEGGS